MYTLDFLTVTAFKTQKKEKKREIIGFFTQTRLEVNRASAYSKADLTNQAVYKDDSKWLRAELVKCLLFLVGPQN